MSEPTAMQDLVAEAIGLHQGLADRLQGNTVEEMTAHAERLKRVTIPRAPEQAEEEGIGGGTRREPRKEGLTREAIAKLAKEDPRKFNDMLDAGEIFLSKAGR